MNVVLSAFEIEKVLEMGFAGTILIFSEEIVVLKFRFPRSSFRSNFRSSSLIDLLDIRTSIVLLLMVQVNPNA